MNRPHKRNSAHRWKRVSVIIPTRNRSKSLQETLTALSRQTVKPKEIFIVSASDIRQYKSEHSCVVSLLKSQASQYKLMRVRHKNKSYSCNIGIQHAAHSSDIIAFIDDDCVPNHTWIEAIIEHHDALPSAGAITGEYYRYHDNYFSHVLFDHIENSYAQTWKENFFLGGNVSFKKKFLIKHQLSFNERFYTCEDFELSCRIVASGCAIYMAHDDRLAVRHKFRNNTPAVLVRAFQYGYEDFFVMEKYGTNRYFPGQKMRLARFFWHLPAIYKDAYMYSRTLRMRPFYVPGFMMYQTAKIFGILFAYIRSAFVRHQYID